MRFRLHAVLIVAALLVSASCASQDRAPRPIGEWTVVADGSSHWGSFRLLAAEASRDDALCYHLDLEPQPDLGPEPDDPPLHEGLRYGCLRLPRDNRPVMFGTRRIGGDRAVVLAFVQEGATAWLSTEDGTTIDDASSSDSSSRYDVFIGFPAPTDEPDEVFVRNDDAEYACRFPAPTDIDVDCDLQ